MVNLCRYCRVGIRYIRVSEQRNHTITYCIIERKPLELRQLNLFNECTSRHSALVNDAIEALAKNGGTEARGAIFTRLEVVDFILDLAGYTEDQPLQKKRILEPSFGSGDFLLAVVRRLLKAWRASNGMEMSALEDIGDAILAA